MRARPRCSPPSISTCPPASTRCVELLREHRVHRHPVLKEFSRAIFGEVRRTVSSMNFWGSLVPTVKSGRRGLKPLNCDRPQPPGFCRLLNAHTSAEELTGKRIPVGQDDRVAGGY